MTLAVGATPLAVSSFSLLVVYLIPIAVLYWILRLRTTVDTDTVVVRGVLRTTTVAWSDITSLRLRSSWTRSRVSAVLVGGAELPLPAVHVSDLPVLAMASGGRVPDPTSASTEPTAQPSNEPTAAPTSAPTAEPTTATPASPEE
jgi:hypothetical protein